jgi:ATP-dependent Clp endopeptidase proteolytic subunit ClpP
MILAKAKGLELKVTKTTIQGQAVPRGELYVYGDIVSEKWFEGDVAPADVVNLLNEMASLQVSDIDVYVNSMGGSVFAGTAIYSALKRHPAAINVQVDGIAASIASVIAMAGDLISIADAGMIMVHSPWSVAMGNAAELRKQADVLDQVEVSMREAYINRTGIDEKQLAQMLADETWMTAKEAVELGFADEIVQVTDVAAQYVPEDRFRNTPEWLKSGSDFKIPCETTACRLQGASADTSTGTAEDAAMPDPIDIDTQLKAARETAAEEAKAAAIAEEKARKKHINALFLRFPQHADLRQECMDDMDCTIEAANTKLLDKLAEGAGPLGGASRIEDLGSEHEKFKAGIVDGILQKAQAKPIDESNPYRGFSMRDVARVCAAKLGHPVDRMGTEQIIRAALTSESDFPTLYENAMHKVLLNAYRVQPDTWSEFMGTTTLADFRPHNRYRMGTFGNLPTLTENGEIPRTNLQDAEKEQISAVERGMIFDLSFKAIVDDDLGGLTRVATQMGRAARRTVESSAYDLLISNPTMGDGVALFDAAHNNMAATGSEISVESLGEARAAMRRQMDPSSNEYIDLLPAVLLCPVEIGDLARQVVASETDPSQTNSRVPNPIRNMVRVIDTPRLSGTGWYLFASPMDTAVGEVGFLNGMSEPEMMMEELFESRGVQWRVTLDFGVAMLEWRAGYYNEGAAPAALGVQAKRTNGKK